MKQKKKKPKLQKKPQRYISVFNKPTGQQLLTPAICTWILEARNFLHLVEAVEFSSGRASPMHCTMVAQSNEWTMKFTTF